MQRASAFDSLILSIAQLRKAGLFDPNHSGILGFECGDCKYIVRLIRPDRLEIMIERRRHLTIYHASVERVRLNFGIRRYLVCPQTDCRCQALYLWQDNLVSDYYLTLRYPSNREDAKQASIKRRLDRLTGTVAKGPARGANRRKLAENLRPDGWIRMVAPSSAMALDKVRDREKQLRERRARKAGQLNPLSAAAGFAAGQRMKVELDRIDSENFFRRYGGQPPQRALTKAFVEDFPYLTIGDLKRNKLLAPGGVSGRTLDWSEQLRLIVECHLFNLDKAFVLVRSRFGGPERQLIHLVQGASQVGWYLLCPFTGKRCAKLFYRNGLFGSARGNHLIHRSQRKSA